MKKINLLDLEETLNILERENFDDAFTASMHGSYNDVWFHKGFDACIFMLKEYYNFKKDIDICKIMNYL